MKRRPQNSPFSLVSPSSCSNTKVPASLFLPYLSPHYPMFPSSPPDEFPPQPQPAPNPPLHSNTTAVSGRRSSASPRHRPPEDVDNHQNPQQQGIRCPRCDSTNTKFCYYNNYSLAQPRHFCKTCRRYWTNGGAIRNIPIGGGCRKNKKPRFITPGSTPLGSSSGSGGELNLFQGIHFDALSSSSPALHVGYPQPGNHAGINFSVPPPRFSLYNSNNTNHHQQQQTNYLSSSLVNQHNGNHVISFNPPVLQSYLQSPPPSMSGGSGDHHHSVDLTGGGGGSTSGSRSSSLLGLNFNHHHHSFTTPSSTSTGGMMCGQYGEISGLISSGGGGNANTSPVGGGTSLITTCIESLSSINQELHLKLQQQRLALYYSGVGGGSIGKGNGNGNVKAEEKVGGGQGQGQQLDVGVGVSCNQQQHAEETNTRVQTEKPQGMFFQSLEMATSNNRYDEKTRGGDDHGTEWCFGSGSNGTETTTVAMSTVALATTTTTTSGFSTSNGGGNSVSWSSDNPFTFSNLIGLDKH